MYIYLRIITTYPYLFLTYWTFSSFTAFPRFLWHSPLLQSILEEILHWFLNLFVQFFHFWRDYRFFFNLRLFLLFFLCTVCNLKYFCLYFLFDFFFLALIFLILRCQSFREIPFQLLFFAFKILFGFNGINSLTQIKIKPSLQASYSQFFMAQCLFSFLQKALIFIMIHIPKWKIYFLCISRNRSFRCPGSCYHFRCSALVWCLIILKYSSFRS